MTDASLVSRDLCLILSNLFVGGHIDYAYIASVAKKFKITEVEHALIDCVAPVLWSELYSPTPEIWGYDEEYLWSEIQKNIDSAKKSHFLNKLVLRLRRVVMKWMLKTEWARLMEEMNHD